MPNGGSDCCGTCWFNSANAGRAGYHRSPPDAEVRCTIRGDVIIRSPFWTYCVNHPHHNSARLELPIGPIYEDAGGFPYSRRVAVESPDSPQIRDQLLALLAGIEEQPRPEYPSSTRLDDTVVLQLGLFQEPRAVPDLRRILAFDPFRPADADRPDGSDRVYTMARAVEALSRILGDGALPDVETCLAMRRDDDTDDRFAAVRYRAVEALGRMTWEKVEPVLMRAAGDRNEEVAQLAQEMSKG